MPKSSALPSLAQVEAELGRRSLYEFGKMAWAQVEPNTEFQDGWHIGAICEHLEAVTHGQIRDLLINVPPRFGKSLWVSVLWPCWEWARNPGIQWLFASYAESLSVRDNIRARRILGSVWYQARWPLALAGDQNTKLRVDNMRGGYRIATSVSGTATGEGGDRLVADDPHNMKEILSEASRGEVIFWWDEVMPTRRNNPKTASRLIIMQRGHEKDLSGHVLEQGGYVHLMLPMRYEAERRCVTPLGGDPRWEDGELLWPARFGEAEVSNLEKNLGAYAAAGQLQQRPAPRSGGMFAREAVEIVDTVPPGLNWVRGWDMAATAPRPGTDPDYTVGAKVAVVDGMVYVANLVRERLGASEVETILRLTAQADGKGVRIAEEEEPGSAGKALTAHHRKTVFSGYSFFAERPTGDKVVRAEPLAAAWRAWRVKLLRGEWNTPFLDEMRVFPGGSHDDQVDAVALAYTVAKRYETKALSEEQKAALAAPRSGGRDHPF